LVKNSYQGYTWRPQESTTLENSPIPRVLDRLEWDLENEQNLTLMTMGNKVANFNGRHRLLVHGDRVLVAVSGGPDSVALLHLLYEFRGEWALHLEVAHLQHGIRGEEARGDAQFVAGLAEMLKLPFHIKEIDLPQVKSDAGKGNLEALARSERYRFFAQVVEARKLNKVATAHTQDDQAETVLMWLLRGAGMKGMGGMSPQQEVRLDRVDSAEVLTVIRPLLEVSKSEILEYLAEKGLNYRVDRSNQDPVFLRNWIRSELIPKIRQRVDSRFAARLSRQAELIRDENIYLEKLARERFEALQRDQSLIRSAFLDEAKALQRRILRLWIEQARGHLRSIEFVHIEALLRLIEEGPVQGRLAVPGGWELVCEYERLRLERRRRGLKKVCYCYRLEIGMTLTVGEAGIEFRSKRLLRPPMRLQTDPMEAVFDAARLTGPLWVRNFRNGDRFQPLGMIGHKKIKDLFIENKVPRSVRAKWPLLGAGQEVLWIPGYGRSAAGPVTGSTGEAIYFRAIPIPS
jgi:tRNA(Ile)-lysidine synthase